MIKRYFRDSEISYTLGIAPTIELLQHKRGQVTELVMSHKAAESEQIGKLIQLCRENNIPVEFDDKQLARLNAQENTYVAGAFYKYATEINANANFVVLAQPSDYGNLGTILRTMAAFGFHDLAIIEPAVDVWDPKAIRASMGAVFQINVHMFPTFEDFTKVVTHKLFMFTGDGKQSVSDVKLAEPYALVFGAEGAGLPDEYLKQGTTVKIPQTDKVDSLNLSIAVGVALFEASRKK